MAVKQLKESIKKVQLEWKEKFKSEDELTFLAVLFDNNNFYNKKVQLWSTFEKENSVIPNKQTPEKMSSKLRYSRYKVNITFKM